MTRLNEKEIKKIVKLKIHNLVVKILLPISDLHIKEKLNFSNKYYIQKIKDCLDILKKDKKGVVFVLMIQNLEKLKEYMEIISKYQVRTVTFADTVGCSTPLEYAYF